MTTRSRKLSTATTALRAVPDAALLDDGMLRVKEACDFLGCSRSKLYLLMDGPLPWVQRGPRRFIPRRALVEYAKAGLVRRDLAS